jgi:hypothetical protein
MYTISDPSARVWIFEMMAKLNMDEFIKVLVMLWAMWMARRKAIHEGEFQSLMATHCFVRRFLDDLALIAKPVSMPIWWLHGCANQGGLRLQITFSRQMLTGLSIEIP